MKMAQSSPKRVENTVGKGEIALYEKGKSSIVHLILVEIIRRKVRFTNLSKFVG